MVRSTAVQLRLHVNGRNLWGDSACSPELAAMATRLPFGGQMSRFGGDAGNNRIGQSYDPGAHPSG